MAAVGGIVIELLWGILFLFSLFSSIRVPYITDYMFDPTLPIWLRFLSFYHVIIPFLLLFLIRRLGYVRLALPLQTLLTWILLIVAWSMTEPALNINGVFGYQHLAFISAFLYLILEALLIALIFFATHCFLIRFKKKSSN
ncbi:MAG TPA: hypothetical protein VLG76_02960 [Rhabdochlamydiaceae bacterium]|nr:hypothetical protein [Rhabdochlamydiaceae bacterium]